MPHAHERRLGALVGPEEEEAADGDPHDARLHALEERGRALVGDDAPEGAGHAVVGHAGLVRAEHEPRLDHVQRRRDGRRERAGDAAAERGLVGPQLPGGLRGGPDLLEVLVERELDEREGDLARDGAAVAAPESEHALGIQHVPQRPLRRREHVRLHALLDYLRRHAHHAGGHLAEARGGHVRDGRRLHSRLEVLLRRLVAHEEERRAGGAAHGGGANALEEPVEAAALHEPLGRLQPRLDGVEWEEHDVDGGAGDAAADEGHVERHGRGRRRRADAPALLLHGWSGTLPRRRAAAGACAPHATPAQASCAPGAGFARRCAADASVAGVGLGLAISASG
mmetsp:Transcript_4688/g.13356  ORF Transcript_4688/g.13356 Transcript_4688/m.13356 type:complete len:340 (+) Transcript_4688:189-1208(+)